MDRRALGMIGKSIKGVAEQIIRPMTATVATSMASWNQTGVVLDSDPSERQVIATSLLGPLSAGTRVFCLAYPPRGLVILGILGVSGSPGQQVFTSNDTWTKPAGLRSVSGYVQAGGGAGGGAAATAAGQASSGAGGGGGACADFWIPADLLPASGTVTVGGGGAGVSGGTGSTGGQSDFLGLVTADGGTGGQAMAAVAAGATTPLSMNATPGEGSIVGTFAPGVIGFVLGGSDGHTPYAMANVTGGLRGGTGGGGALSGDRRASSANSTNGLTGHLYGGGGSGSSNGPSQSARAGGMGGAGIIIVRHHF